MKIDIDFAGIANAPSDYNSADGVMAHLVNLIPEDNELKAVGKGTVLFTVPEDYSLAYVHQVKSDSKHYIFIKKETDSEGNITSTLYWRLASVEEEETAFNKIGTVNGTPKLVSIGNTLIAYSHDEMRYFLWKEVKQDDGTYKYTYKDLGNHLPELDAQFKLEYVYPTTGWTVTEEETLPEKLVFDHHPGSGWPDKYEKEQNNEEVLCGLANTYISLIHKYGHFVFPFFVRYAYRLYDGTTLTMHSAPILMTPSTYEAFYVGLSDYVSTDNTTEYKYTFAVNSSKLRCMISTAQSTLDDFSDIIKSIDIFISAPIYTYKQAGYTENEFNKKNYCDVIDLNDNVQRSYGVNNGYITTVYHASERYAMTLPRFTDEEIEKDVKSRALFYFLKSISIDKISEYSNFKDINIEESYLSSLVNKEVMTDDYNSHNILRPASAFVYNSRMNLANIQSEIFSGWSCGAVGQFFVEHGSYTAKELTFIRIYYKGHNNQGTFIIKPKSDLWGTHIPLYLYHPYSNVTEALVFLTTPGAGGESTTRYISVEMKQHDFLNGSFGVLPFWEKLYNKSSGFRWYNWTTYWEENGIEGTYPDEMNITVEDNNKVYTSEANMPFYFPVTGINTIGTGNILALTSITKALSEGQFGQFPLYAFTDEGIWALALSETGSISSVSPVTRDVCNNEKSITQIDDAIIFSSDRGLMMLTGSDSKCLSEQLDGNWFDGTSLKGWPQLNILFPAFQNYNLKFGSFKEFVKDAVIVYDYPRQRVLVLNVNNDIAMAYSLRSQQWGQVKVGYAIAVANSYPGSVIQVQQFLSFSEREILDISSENSSDVPSVGITRPISFGDKNALKTVNDLIMRGDNVAVVLYGTRNNTDWHLVGSSKNRYLRGLCGSPYKAFRLLFIKQMQPGQIIKGASFEITPKDNNVLR